LKKYAYKARMRASLSGSEGFMERRRPSRRQPEAVRVWMLGDFRVSVGSRVIRPDEWRLKKAANLVKLLALAVDHRMHKEQVMELLWPELGSEAAANNMHYALHCARRALEPDTRARAFHYLLLGGETLALCPEGHLSVDVECFEEAATAARSTREPAAYRAAIELYAGDLLPQDRYEGWAEDRRQELRSDYLALLAELAQLDEEDGKIGPAIEALRRITAEEPTNEDAHIRLIRLYDLAGRRQEALRQYERLEMVLSRTFGREPDGEGRYLYEQLRTALQQEDLAQAHKTGNSTC
jgi:DNA-binding SARP family transcriptional activator